MDRSQEYHKSGQQQNSADNGCIRGTLGGTPAGKRACRNSRCLLVDRHRTVDIDMPVAATQPFIRTSRKPPIYDFDSPRKALRHWGIRLFLIGALRFLC